jgi:hypothetical protein
MKVLNITGRMKKAEWFIKLDDFKGVATLLDDVILGMKFAKEVINMMMFQDGRWGSRWGTAHYGLAVTGETKIIATGKYVTAADVEEKIAICSSGKAYKSVDQGAWTEITGAVFDTSATLYSFEQVDNMLLIANGFDRLTRYNGTNLIRYTTLAAPTGLAGVKNVLTAGSYNNFYQVTALNEVGETIGSAEINVPTNKHRNAWITTSNERIDLTWSAVAGATRYQIYWDDETGGELLLAETSTTTTSYNDDGTATQNPFVTIPAENSTGAPAFKAIAFSGSRLWGITDETVWWSGTDPYLGYFSDAYGGGWQPLKRGGGEKLVSIKHFRTPKGDSVATVISRNKAGLGSVWQVPLEVTTIADTTIIVPNPTRLPGPIGTVAMNGVVEANDALYLPNSRGIFTLNNKANIQNILSTDELSGNIRPSFRDLKNIENMAGIWYDSKVIFSGSEGGNGNDCMFLLDTELNEWAWKWTIGFRSFLEVTEADGTSKLLGVPNDGNQLIEISKNIKGDLGQPFYQSWLSGLIPISRDATAFANVQEALVELGRPVGTIYFEVLGVQMKKGFTSLATRQITDSVSNIDFTNGLWNEYMFDEDDDTPKVYSQPSVRKAKRIGKKLNSIQFHVYSNTADTEFTILSIQAKGVLEKLRTPSNFFK